ncbi:MAG TPA: hypothetical protein VGO61_09435 [Steroidobacteraceae bacterium]|nr:hypothetical protein [Steroidobacteraceae bacterium]
MKTACALQLERVLTEEGRELGKVFDLRCEWRAGQAQVTHLVYGRRGLWERLGFRRQRHDKLPWSAVVRIEDRDVIVATDATSRSAPLAKKILPWM